MIAPLLSELRGSLQACGRVRLVVRLDDGSIQEGKRLFLTPTAESQPMMQALERLLEGVEWSAAATALEVSLDQIQDAAAEQLSLFAREREREQALWQVQRHLAARFGAHLLRRAVLAQPGAPLPEWRTGWLAEDEP
jgi:hypothetical protein